MDISSYLLFSFLYGWLSFLELYYPLLLRFHQIEILNSLNFDPIFFDTLHQLIYFLIFKNVFMLGKMFLLCPEFTGYRIFRSIQHDGLGPLESCALDQCYSRSTSWPRILPTGVVSERFASIMVVCGCYTLSKHKTNLVIPGVSSSALQAVRKPSIPS